MKKSIPAAGGFSLVEIAIALGVAFFCLLTLVALLPVAMQRYRAADVQGSMVNVATMTVRDLQAAPAGGTSPRFGFTIPAAGGTASTAPEILYLDLNGQPTSSGSTPVGVAATSASVYRVSVGFTPPGTGQRVATTARVVITWPAQSDARSTAWPANYSEMFETAIALNRN